MRVIENSGFYFPDSSGGTEVYVSNLVQGLQEQGIECTVAAPSQSGPSRYVHEGVAVFRYPVPANWSRGEVQGRVPPGQFEVFEDWLKEQRAEIYHQHAWTSACGLYHLQAAKRLGLKTLVTVHVPGNVCLRGTMLYEGRTACDGAIEAGKCASCWLQSKGMSAGAARRLAALPRGLAPLQRMPRIGPAFAAKALAADHAAQLREMAANADRIIAVCGWLHDALAVNGVPHTKLILNRHGVAQPITALRKSGERPNLLRVGFLGRFDPLKGLHVLVDAFKRLPANIPIELDVRAVTTQAQSGQYRELVLRSAAADRRIRIHPALAHQEVESFLADIDVLAVPSQWLETGPLVVLEAFAAGTPVIGSDIGGIKELVTSGHDGLLVPHDDVSAWTAALMRLAMEPALPIRLRDGIAPVRTLSDVARDLAALYRELSVIGSHAS